MEAGMPDSETNRDLWLKLLEDRHPAVELSAAEVETFMAGVRDRLRATLAEMTALPTEPDLAAFLDQRGALTHAQQRQLFADPALRARFRAMVHDRAVERPGAAAAAPATTRLLQMPIQVAAASAEADRFERRFPGGSLRIIPVGIDQQVYIVITFDDPTIAARALLIEHAGSDRMRRLDLPPPDGGEVVLVVDLAVTEDAELVGVLRDPQACGTFLR